MVRPGQMVAVKVNTLGGRGLSTNVQLVEAICERLQAAGIRAQDIVIWDRDSAELERAGFRVRTGASQVQCFGTDRVGFEEDLVSVSYTHLDVYKRQTMNRSQVSSRGSQLAALAN